MGQAESLRGAELCRKGYPDSAGQGGAKLQSVYETQLTRIGGGPPDRSTGFSLVRRNSFSGETPVLRKRCASRGFPVIWLCPENCKSKSV